MAGNGGSTPPCLWQSSNGKTPAILGDSLIGRTLGVGSVVRFKSSIPTILLRRREKHCEYSNCAISLFGDCLFGLLHSRHDTLASSDQDDYLCDLGDRVHCLLARVFTWQSRDTINFSYHAREASILPALFAESSVQFGTI